MLSQQFLCSILSIYPFSVDWFIHHLHKRTHLHSTVTPQQRARVHSLLGHEFVQGETTHKCWFEKLKTVTRTQISGQANIRSVYTWVQAPKWYQALGFFTIALRINVGVGDIVSMYFKQITVKYMWNIVKVKFCWFLHATIYLNSQLSYRFDIINYPLNYFPINCPYL